jgi:hypothetical protein
MPSLKNIDVQRHAVMLLLDAFGLDVDPSNGRIYYAENPEVPIAINDREICVDIGKKNIDKRFTVYNPMLREDHAQFLLTLAVHSLVLSELLTLEEAENNNFDIHSELLTTDIEGNAYIVPKTEISITSKEGIEVVGVHEEPALAMTLAVIQYLYKIKYILQDTYDKVCRTLHEAYTEYIRLQELKTSERKKIIKEKETKLTPPPDIDAINEFMVDDFNDLPIPEDTFYSDNPLENIEFMDVDFEQADSENGEIESDLTDEELYELGMEWKNNEVLHKTFEQQKTYATPLLSNEACIQEDIDNIDYFPQLTQTNALTVTNSNNSYNPTTPIIERIILYPPTYEPYPDIDDINIPVHYNNTDVNVATNTPFQFTYQGEDLESDVSDILTIPSMNIGTGLPNNSF